MPISLKYLSGCEGQIGEKETKKDRGARSDILNEDIGEMRLELSHKRSKRGFRESRDVGGRKRLERKFRKTSRLHV